MIDGGIENQVNHGGGCAKSRVVKGLPLRRFSEFALEPPLCQQPAVLPRQDLDVQPRLSGFGAPRLGLIDAAPHGRLDS